MRMTLAGALVVATAIAGFGVVHAQDKQVATAGDAKSTAAPTPASVLPTCDNAKALGVSRVVEIDTTGGPGFGFEHFKAYDFLRPNEVVLTFDDGPWPSNTQTVLKALADQCVRATFFPIGKHATWHPDILRLVDAAGHTIGSHTWSHQDLSRKPFDADKAKAEEEIELGVSAVAHAIGHPAAPFFRFPALKHPPELVQYVGNRNIGIFSTDMDSFDFKMRKPDQVIKSVMGKLAKHGKGIVLMHDFQRVTTEALPELLQEMKDKGYKVVHVVGRAPVKTIAKYDEKLMQQKDIGIATVTKRPLSSVVRTIAE